MPAFVAGLFMRRRTNDTRPTTDDEESKNSNLKIKKKIVSKEDVKGIMYAVCGMKNKAKGRK